MANFLRYAVSHPSVFFGLTITLFFIAITVLDFAFPGYLGVSNASTLFSFADLQNTVTLQPSPPTFSDGWWFIFGTTSYRLPILPLMLASIATDIEFSALIVAVSAFIGTFAGIFSASYGRRTDLLFMRFTDIFISFPAIIMVIIYDSVAGWTYTNMSIGILLIWWTTYARIARSVTLPLNRTQFMEAAIASGCSKFQLIRKHIFPNVMSFIFVQITLDIGMVISIFATVNYLFSSLNTVNAFLPEIGDMMVGFPEAGVILYPTYFAGGGVSTGLWLISGTWWPIVIPGVFLIVFILGVNLLGNGLRDFVNPKNR